MRNEIHWKVALGVAAALLFAGQGCPAAPGQVKKNAAMEKKEKKNVLEQTYSVRVDNQTAPNGTVVIAEVNGLEATWVAIHREEAGKPGPVIGHGLVAAGMQKNVSIDIDASKATPALFAMLHEDKGEVGVYEFPGLDAPVKVNDQIVMVKFTAAGKARGAIMKKKDEGARTEKTVDISATAKRWEFSPATVTVKKGDKVKLSIESMDVTHGFAIPDFDVSATLKPNETTVVEFTADKAGMFTFFCNVFCGQGHPNMKGTLIVE